MAEIDYQSEIKRIEDEVAKREARKNQLSGLLEAKQNELRTIETEIKERFNCEPSELVAKGQSLKEDLEKNIAEMKSKLGLT